MSKRTLTLLLVLCLQENFVGELRTGLVMAFGHFDFAATYAHAHARIRGQRSNDSFGSISLAKNYRWKNSADGACC